MDKQQSTILQTKVKVNEIKIHRKTLTNREKSIRVSLSRLSITENVDAFRSRANFIVRLANIVSELLGLDGDDAKDGCSDFVDGGRVQNAAQNVILLSLLHLPLQNTHLWSLSSNI